MTKQRRIAWVVAACLVLAVGLAPWLETLWPHPVNRANFNRLREGMTFTEVKAILGGPPQAVTEDDQGNMKVYYWDHPGPRIEIAFDKNGQVTERTFMERGTFLNRLFALDRLLARFGW